MLGILLGAQIAAVNKIGQTRWGDQRHAEAERNGWWPWRCRPQAGLGSGKPDLEGDTDLISCGSLATMVQTVACGGDSALGAKAGGRGTFREMHVFLLEGRCPLEWL